MNDTMAHKEVLGLRNFVEAQKHMIQGMMQAGKVKNEQEWHEIYGPVFMGIWEGWIRGDDKTANQVIEDGIEYVRKTTKDRKNDT